MQYWLMKTEPATYSFGDLVRDGRTHWDGVRNYLARNNMRAMAEGDLVFLYHSVSEKAVVGLARVVREAYQDPTDETGTWSVVDLVPVAEAKTPCTLGELKADPSFEGLMLLSHSRLSVLPVSGEHATLLADRCGLSLK